MTKQQLVIPMQIREDLWEKASINVNEICGVLIGKKLNKQKFQITHAVFDDKSINPSPFSVTRNTKNLYPLVKEIVENSKENEIDYIGDWHSHPNSTCKYSYIDYNSMKSILSDPDYYFLEEVILIIISPPKNIKSYLFHNTMIKPIEMIII
ncbi:MAG: Mov34/MPN/PAD-1 family protein [Candidatus Helarchaeota archaeon]